MADENVDALAESLHACARQLETLCGQLGLDACANHHGHPASDKAQRSWRQERDDSDEEEEEEPSDGSAVEMAQACMQMLASMEGLSLDACEDELEGDATEGYDSSISIAGEDAHHESQRRLPEAELTNGEKPVLPVNQALLAEMNALSIELSAFTSLLVGGYVECPDDSDVNTLAAAITEQDDGLQHSIKLLNAAVEDDSTVRSEPASDTTADVQAPASKSKPVRVQLDPPLSKAFHNRLPQRNYHQSKLQRFLRAHPPKPNNNSTKRRSKTNTNMRPKPQQQLHAHMREILGSPTLWKEYQSKSFQQHIRRQQQARLLVEQESIEAEKAAAAHFKRAKYALKLSSACSKKPTESVTVSSTAIRDTTYLRRFCKDRRKVALSPHPQPAQQSFPYSPMMAKGLLCGVYFYGKQQLGLAYFTCSSLTQLHERVCQRFDVSSVVNFYRERVVMATNSDRLSPSVPGRKRAAASKTFQRITAFSQVHDGDRLCATRDSYEDMAILCEWIRQRQQRIHHMQQQPNEPPKPPSSSSVQLGHSTSKTAESRAQAATTTTDTLSAHSEENTSLWDANGRCMAVKKQLLM